MLFENIQQFCPSLKEASKFIFLFLIKNTLSGTQHPRSACLGQFSSMVAPSLAVHVLSLHQHSTSQALYLEQVELAML